MSDKIKDGGPAFPMLGHIVDDEWEPYSQFTGMTLRQYAAIKLRVPDSGTDWLDDMIRASLRDDIAAKAMQGMVSTIKFLKEGEYARPDIVSSAAYRVADAMGEAREANHG